MTDDERVAEIHVRCAMATKGPWFRWTAGGDVSSAPEDAIIFQHSGGIDATPNGPCSCTPEADADCEFVAHAREDIPWLITQLLNAEMEAQYWREKFHGKWPGDQKEAPDAD